MFCSGIRPQVDHQCVQRLAEGARGVLSDQAGESEVVEMGWVILVYCQWGEWGWGLAFAKLIYSIPLNENYIWESWFQISRMHDWSMWTCHSCWKWDSLGGGVCLVICFVEIAFSASKKIIIFPQSLPNIHWWVRFIKPPSFTSSPIGIVS